MLAAELISPLVVPNSSLSLDLTTQARTKAADAVAPVPVTIRQGEVIVRNGSPLTATDIEKIDALGLRQTVPDVASFGGWLLLAVLVVGMLLAWIWRFRPTLWHRDNVLILIGLLLVGATLALKVTAGRPTLPFFLPTAAIAMLLAILLDASLATFVIAIVAVIGGAVNGSSLEFAAYVFLGGMAGIVTVRRGDRLQVFVQASIAVLVVEALVVLTFSLLGARDLRGVLELWFASAASAAGSGIAAVGSFAALGSVFGILTVFQLLELANPSQPLLRRLLVETPGTYHHSLMVGNLAERAAEAIGADPLVTRVAAYYHDIGKLANPLAFIENQAGGDNIHDQLEPGGERPDPQAARRRRHRPRLQVAAAQGAHRVHPAAPRDGDHELLLRPCEGAGRAGRDRGRAQVPPRRAEAPVARGGAHHARRRRRGVRPVARLARRAGDPGDGRPDHRGAAQRWPVRRVRPDPARRRADPRGVRRPAARHVPPADRLPAEQGRRARITAGGRRRGVGRGVVTRALYLDPWRVDVTIRDGVVAPVSAASLARVIAGALAAAGAPAPASIGLILADDRELAALNTAHLGKTGPTDVLSFPLLPPAAFPAHPGATDRGTGTAPDFALPPGRRPHLGDIVISVQRAIEQARQGRGGQTGDVRWSPADELRLLATHGALHVCGWDHAEPEEEAAMRALEQGLLAGAR